MLMIGTRFLLNSFSNNLYAAGRREEGNDNKKQISNKFDKTFKKKKK